MFSDLQTFTISGETKEELQKVLQLAVKLSGWDIKAFFKDKNGLVFCYYKGNGDTEYPFKPTVPVLVEQIYQYLDDLDTEDTVRLAGGEPDIDGSVRLGWEVFHPLWYGENEIEKYNDNAVIAVRPCWVVYGK